MYVCENFQVQIALEASSWDWMPQSWSYRYLWGAEVGATNWAQVCYKRAVGMPNLWALSSQKYVTSIVSAVFLFL